MYFQSKLSSTDNLLEKKTQPRQNCKRIDLWFFWYQIIRKLTLKSLTSNSYYYTQKPYLKKPYPLLLPNNFWVNGD